MESAEIVMTEKLTNDHRRFWNKLSKTDVGSKKSFIGSLILYGSDISLLFWNIYCHISNEAYFACAGTVLVHSLSAFVISSLYCYNKVEIDLIEEKKHKQLWKIFRYVSMGLGATPLYRIISNWEDQDVKHASVRENEILRNSIDSKEVEALVRNKERKLVTAYFDCVHAYLKTFLQAIFQIYLAMDNNLPLIFCTMTDLFRFINGVVAIILAAKAVASYVSVLDEYLNTLYFQDFFVHGHNDGIGKIKKYKCLISFLGNMFVVGSRLFAIGFLMTFRDLQARVLIFLLFAINLLWIRVFTTTRPIYENPPSGKTTIFSEIVDRFIGIFCFHQIRPNRRNIVIHQLLFIVALFFVRVGNLILTSTSEDYLQNSTNSSAVFVPNCNFSNTNNLTNWFLGVLNFNWKSERENSSLEGNSSTNSTLIFTGDSISHYKDIFGNEPLVFIFLVLTAAVAIIFANIKCVSGEEESNSKLSLQVSLPAWKQFFNIVQNKIHPTERTSAALKLVLLGVLSNSSLERCNFKLPGDILNLRDFMSHFIKCRGNNFLDEDPDEPQNNPCQNGLTELINLFTELRFEEAVWVSTHLKEHFYIYIEEMTSYRLALTEEIISGRQNVHCLLPFEVSYWWPMIKETNMCFRSILLNNDSAAPEIGESFELDLFVPSSDSTPDLEITHL